jgi:hypothetical protein
MVVKPASENNKRKWQEVYIEVSSHLAIGLGLWITRSLLIQGMLPYFESLKMLLNFIRVLILN